MAKVWDHLFLDLKFAICISDPIDSFYTIFSLVGTNEVFILNLYLSRNRYLN